MYRLISGVMLVLMLVCGPVLALESDRQQKIYIESHELDIDEADGVSEYRGEVQFTRGSIHLTADKVRIFEKEGELQKLLAWGQPVHIRQQLDDNRGETRAVANRMEYMAASDRLFLYGDAHLWQKGNEFSGDVIEYHLADEKVVARGDESQSGRVHIVIEPVTKHDSTDTDPADGDVTPNAPSADVGATDKVPQDSGDNALPDKARP